MAATTEVAVVERIKEIVEEVRARVRTGPAAPVAEAPSIAPSPTVKLTRCVTGIIDMRTRLGIVLLPQPVLGPIESHPKIDKSTSLERK